MRNPSAGSGLFKSDEKGQFQDCGEFKAERGNTSVTALLEDHEGAVWIGTSFSGLFRHDESGFESIETTHATGEEALRHLPAEEPDVVLMDINLPGMSGIECVARLKERLPKTQVLMLTTYEESDLIFDSLRGGASGYLLIYEKLHVQSRTQAVVKFPGRD